MSYVNVMEINVASSTCGLFIFAQNNNFCLLPSYCILSPKKIGKVYIFLEYECKLVNLVFTVDSPA